MSFSRSPTKARLLAERKNLLNTRKVYNILEDKKALLMKRMNETTKEAVASRHDALDKLLQAYELFGIALAQMGEEPLKSITKAYAPNVELEATQHKLMDVAYYSLKVRSPRLQAPGVKDIPIKFYQARDMLLAALSKLAEAAALEDLLIRIAVNLEKTRRLTSSIDKIVIPTHQSIIKSISLILEERDREELIRLKKIKKGLSAKEVE